MDIAEGVLTKYPQEGRDYIGAYMLEGIPTGGDWRGPGIRRDKLSATSAVRGALGVLARAGGVQGWGRSLLTPRGCITVVG